MDDIKDLATVVADLKSQGYNYEFTIKNKHLHSDNLNKGFAMDKFIMDET